MPRHKVIHFREPTFKEEIQERLVEFADNHPVATSGMQALLFTIAIGGVLTISAMAPGLSKVWGKRALQKKQEQRQRYKQLWMNFYRLRKDNCIVYKGNKDGEAVYELTEKGKKRLQKFIIETLEIKAPKRWDSMWRVVLFDIPVGKRKSVRNSFREKLRELGCFQFQRSVWVHPFPCEAEIQYLKDFYRLGSCVTVWKVSEMPNGHVLHYFKDILKEHV